MTFVIAPIVEGHGDVDAVRFLLQTLRPHYMIASPIRVPRSRLVIEEHAKKYSRIAEANIADLSGNGCILAIFDSDRECAIGLSSNFKKHISTSSRSPCECVVPVSEYEAWLVAGNNEHNFDGDAEELRDPKGILRDWYGKYRETVDQARMTARIDFDKLRKNSRSFRALDTALSRIDLMSDPTD